LDLKRKIRDGRHRLWWRLARQGQKDAFGRLYGELYGPVAGYVGARVGNRQDTEDLVGQIFHRFVENLERYESGRGSVMSWVLAMARNAVIDHHRHQAAHGSARSQACDVDDLIEVLAVETETPLAAMVRAEEMAQVQSWLRNQPAPIREMFALRYGQGLRLKEVAQVMGVSEAATKQRFARTTRQLRRDLQQATAAEPEREGGSECLITD